MRSRTRLLVVALMCLFALTLSACGQPTATPVPAIQGVTVVAPTAVPAAAEKTTEPAAPSEPTDIKLQVAGQVFDAAALRDFVVEREVETPKGEKRAYKGYDLQPILAKAALQEGTFTFVASDGYEVEVAVADVNAECMLALNDKGGLDAVMPGLEGGAWCRDVVEIRTAGAAPVGSDEPVIVTINGVAFSQSDLAALGEVEAKVDGTAFKGVSFLAALEAAGVAGGDLLMTATDGYSAGVSFDALTPECLLAYEEGGTVAAVLPGLDRGQWVRMLGEITVEGGAPAKESKPTPAPTVPADAVLVVGTKAFTMADLEALPQLERNVEGTVYKGVAFLDVLEAAGLSGNAFVMTASDGYVAGVAMDALSPDCMLAYEPAGTVGAVLPGQSRGGWVKSLESIMVDEAAPAAPAPAPAAKTESSAPAGETQVVVDSLGKEVTIPAEVRDVASMRSGITEVICALGKKDLIMAVDEMTKMGSGYGAFIASVHPDLMDRAAPFRNRDINAEEMVRLDPDVVLHGGYGRIRQAEALQKQVPQMPIVIAHFETIEHYMEDVRIVAQCVGAEDAAEGLIRTLQGTLDFVAERVADIPEGERTRVFYGGHDIYHPYTSTTFEHAQIEVAGGVNVAGEMEGWLPEVSAEQLLIWDPEVIVVLNGVDVDAILADPKVQGLSAIQNKRVYALPEAGWDFSSPRALFCIEWLAVQLYPERFADLDIDAEADAFYRSVFGVDYRGEPLGSGAVDTTAPRTITDMIGRKVRVPGRVERIMPLSSDITAIVLALGAGDRLAAVDSMTAGNEALVKAFPLVADLEAPCAFYNANPESILAVDPDVVLTVSWQRDPNKLQEMMDVPVVCVDLNLYASSIGFLSEVLGTGTRADEICGYYHGRMEAIRNATQGVKERVRVYVAGGDGMMSTFGAESTWHYEILDAGGTNVGADLKGGGSHGVSPEQVMLWDPQVVILDASCPDDVDDLMADARWAGITAVKEGRVYRASPGFVGTWGRPHIESALARVWLADKLYPELLDFDIMAEARTFYEQLYGRAFSDAELEAILGE